MKTLHEIEIKSTTNSCYRVKITLSRDNETYVIEIHSTQYGKPWTWQKNEYDYSEALKQFTDLVEQYAKHTILMNI